MLVGSANIALTFPRACSHRARLRCNCLTKVEALKHVWSAPLRPDSWGLGELTGLSEDESRLVGAVSERRKRQM
jgi:hypothetical protein